MTTHQYPNGKIDEFTVSNRKCTVRAVQDPATFGWKVQAYVESTPIGPEYTVTAENVSDARMQNPDADIVADLMDQARDGVEGGTVPLPPKAP